MLDKAKVDKAKAIRVEKLCWVARKVCGITEDGYINGDTFEYLNEEDKLKMRAIVRELTPLMVRENIK